MTYPQWGLWQRSSGRPRNSGAASMSAENSSKPTVYPSAKAAKAPW